MWSKISVNKLGFESTTLFTGAKFTVNESFLEMVGVVIMMSPS